MSAHPPVGVLRTVRQQAEDAPGRFGSQSPQSWDVIPGVKVRNDGVYPAVLLPGHGYQLAHDGIVQHRGAPVGNRGDLRVIGGAQFGDLVVYDAGAVQERWPTFAVSA